MNTPIADFVERYAAQKPVRFHMPGHKGVPILGCEPWDITEIRGADALYEADGIIAASEEQAAQLFGSGGTLYAAEGSSQCIRAMLYLALTNRPAGADAVIVAARNVHKAFVYAAALLDLSVVWLWPEERHSLCGCPVTAESLERTLSALPSPPAAVYLTSPDYLGGMAEISALAEVCHRYGTILLVDNAHGAYLHFLPEPCHPLDLGADLCCDSAHKTLPVLTGGAYLHLGKRLPPSFRQNARAAMALFGSTSPSYLILASLDRCNRFLAEQAPVQMAETAERLDALRETLRRRGWQVEESDPLRLTLRGTAEQSGLALAERLRKGGMECEYADPEFLVLMVTPANAPSDLERLEMVLGCADSRPMELPALPLTKGEQVLSIRQALFLPHEALPVEAAPGRICGAPTVACPPAIPIAVSGERIGAEALDLFRHYGIHTVDVLR